MRILPTTRVRERREREAKARTNRRFRRASLVRETLDATGIKRWFVPGSEFEGKGSLTPYAAKEKARRRRVNACAKQARKENR